MKGNFFTTEKKMRSWFSIDFSRFTQYRMVNDYDRKADLQTLSCCLIKGDGGRDDVTEGGGADAEFIAVSAKFREESASSYG